MGLLQDAIDNNIDNNGGIVKTFKNNSMELFDKLKGSGDDVMSIPLSRMSYGSFGFFHYKDDSNWMKYSPVFVIEFKRFENLILAYAVNFNFIPLEVRSIIFDKYIGKNEMEGDHDLRVDFEGVYSILLKYGFEYAIVEYNINQIVQYHRIATPYLYKFLYSQHPINKYDPHKLYSIWYKKLETKEQRHQEMLKSVANGFLEIDKEISNDVSVLRGHIQRLRRSIEKYG